MRYLRPRIHALDERYFAELSTEDRAYWAGFLLADGCVKRRAVTSQSIVLKLGAKDEAHLAAYRTAIGSGHAVTETVHRSGRKMVELSVHSRLMAADIARYGVVPRKTFGHPMPEVPESMLRHFLRGYFDGDGHVGRRGHKTAHAMQYGVAICGTTEFAHWMMEAFRLHTGVAGQVVSAKGCATLRLGGNPQVAAWMQWLYSDSTVALERKRVVAMECARLYAADVEVSVRSTLADVLRGAVTVEAAVHDILALLRRAALDTTTENESKFDRRKAMRGY